MSEYIIEMKNITKKFPKIIANNNITLRIKKGEIFALLGENGAGKSTLMSILFGMYEPEAGEIYIRGKKEVISSPNHAVKLNIGMVHQHFKLIPNYTITKNIILGVEPVAKKFGILPTIDIKNTDKKISELSEKYGLKVNPTMKVEDVSVSTAQRVEILKMLYKEAEILIFDEPTAVLTPQEIKYFLDILKSLQKNGKTIILISHKLEEIKKVADRCGIMNRGKLVDVRNVAETSTKEMAHLMVGKDISFNVSKSLPSFGENILEVNNLTYKNKDGIELIKNISFKVRRGEVFAVAGVSDNGQMELVEAITGFIKPSSGEIIFKKKNIQNLTIRERTEEGMAYIPEDRQVYGLVLDFVLSDNLVLKTYYKDKYCKNGILQRKEILATAKRLIKDFDIRSSEDGNTIVRSMSGGNQQKAIIAREVDLDSDLVIFVQPTRGLDIGAINNIHKSILAQRDKGKAVLLVSLELDEVLSLADTIGVIYNGEILRVEDRNKLTTNEIGEYMMGVKTL
ncbi:MAG: ABC transporter ATP-binding protein [Lachnospirales bacterium]